ncbi:MAG: HAD family phosphatase, partial [Succinivibrio sp.]|nr:HAD family phosphatase [Succinivibrio sp.]
KGVLDINEFVRFAVTPILNFSKEKRDLILDSIVKNFIYPKVRAGALKQIKFHQDRGDTVVIVTSTMDYLVEVVARYLKVEYYLGAPMEQQDGRLTGKQAGIVPYQKDKITCVKKFAMQHNLSLEGMFGYGDSVNDIPMLSICEHKFAVNPNQKLLEHEFIKECTVLNWA